MLCDANVDASGGEENTCGGGVCDVRVTLEVYMVLRVRIVLLVMEAIARFILYLNLTRADRDVGDLQFMTIEGRKGKGNNLAR